MENTIKKETPIDKKEVIPLVGKKYIKYLIIIGVIVLLLIIVPILLVVGRNTANNSKIQLTPTEVLLPSLTPSPTLSSSLLPTKIGIYTVSGTEMYNETILLPEKNNGFTVSIPALDPSGFIYYVDGNKVIQLSLATQIKKEIYVNTNLYTKITNITFLAPSYLYISIISDPLDPNYYSVSDHSSYVVEVNIVTNAVRTIGPLIGITHGYINYLFQSQDNDILNTIEKNYCKGEGEIFAIGSGSAKFITKDGFGCNGSDPYFIGQIENSHQLIFAQPGANSKPDDFVTRYSSLYSRDVFSGGKSDIFDVSILYPENKSILVGETNFALSEDKKILFAIIGSKVFSVDMSAKKIVKTFDLATLNIDISKYTIVTVAKNILYLLSVSTKNFAEFDMIHNTISNYTQNIINDSTNVNTFTYIGNWNNQPVFSATINEEKQ